MENASDPTNVDTLIIENTSYLYNYAYRLTGSKASAEDLVQELFITLAPDNQSIEHVQHPRAWLSTILYRLFVKNWRKDKRSPIAKHTVNKNTTESECIPSDPLTNAVSNERGPHDCLEQDDLRKNLLIALEKLNKDQREIVILHDAEGYTLPELEEKMGIPLGTLKSRLHRARSKLEQVLIRKELF